MSRATGLIAAVGTIAAICGVTGLAAWTIWDAHRAAETHAIHNAENLVAALDHDIERNVEIYDLSLRNVISGLNVPGIWQLPPATRDRVLFDGAAAAQDLGAIYVLDRNGTVLIHSPGRPGRRHSFADRLPFTALRDHPDLGLFISAPFRRNIGNEDWSIAFSRRIEGRGGAFAGAVVGTLRLAYFRRLFAGVDLGPRGTLALTRSDGVVLMREPFSDAEIGVNHAGSPIFARLRESEAGYFVATTDPKEGQRLFVYRKLNGLPLILVATASTNDIFAEWRQKAVFSGVALVVLLGLATLLSLALRRELRRAEDADALLRDAIDSMSEGFVIYDKDDRFVMCNEAYRKLYPANAPVMLPGATFEAILRAAILAGQSPDAIGREEEWIAARMEAHRKEGVPHEHRLSTGRWVLTSERRMRNGGIAGLRVDITALKQIQASLRESQAKLNQAQRVAKTGSVWRDFSKPGAEWSDETCRIFGTTRETFVPNPENFLALVHPEDRALLRASIADSEQGNSPRPLQYRIIRPDGMERWVYREAELIYDETGRLLGRMSTYKDVTDEREAERRQAELESQLRHSQRLEALGNLAGGIAHDLNNTLVPILALSQLAMRRLPPGSAEHRDLETIAQAGAHARDLVKQILAFSRKEPAVTREIDLAALVRNTLTLLRASIPTTIRIVETIETVPPVQGDPSQLNQVVMNLVTNAAQAIGDQIGTVTVTVARSSRRLAPSDAAKTRSPTDGAVRLSVVDTGCGIAPAHLDHVFEPFFTTKEVGQGTGLGLAVVHGIVVGHGGLIECRSRPGEGSEFSVWLPVAAPDVAASADLPPEPKAARRA
jgi:PAS domain S-box-containing protein